MGLPPGVIICINLAPHGRSLNHPRGHEPRALPLSSAKQTPLPLSTGFRLLLRLQLSSSAAFRASCVCAQMLPKRRRVRAGSPHSAIAPSASPTALFPSVAIYLAEPRMGRSRRAFLTRLARSKGFRILDAYRCAAPDGGGVPSSRGAGIIMPVTSLYGRT